MAIKLEATIRKYLHIRNWPFMMSTVQNQKENIMRKESKLQDCKNKVDRQWNTVNVRVAEIHALETQRENVIREAKTLELRYTASLASLQRHEQRLAESGRPGGNGEFERNARNDLEVARKQCKEMQDKIRALDKTIEKARKREGKARDKLDELRGRLSQSRLQLRAEEGKLLRFPDR